MSDPTNEATEPADAVEQPTSPVLRDLLATGRIAPDGSNMFRAATGS